MTTVTTFPAKLRLTSVDVATSSSDLVWQAAAEGAPAGTAFLVGEQTAGRGRRGSGWSSAKGGMYLSILLRPQAAPSDIWGLSFVAALAIRGALAACVPEHDVRLKWPNDVLVGGGKICGLLLEARDGAVVIGTGVNVAPVEPVPGARLPAVSLYDLGDHNTTPTDLAVIYGARLLVDAASWERTGFSPVRLEWLRHCAHMGGRVKVATGSAGAGSPVEGDFIDLGGDGALVLRDDHGKEQRITTGDVELTGRL